MCACKKVLTVLSLPEEFVKKVDKIVFDFVWEGKPHKIKKKHADRR